MHDQMSLLDRLAHIRSKIKGMSKTDTRFLVASEYSGVCGCGGGGVEGKGGCECECWFCADGLNGAASVKWISLGERYVLRLVLGISVAVGE